MRVFDNGLHRTGSLVAEQLPDLAEELALCDVAADEPARNRENDQ
jgi:hypothetical protein